MSILVLLPAIVVFLAVDAFVLTYVLTRRNARRTSGVVQPPPDSLYEQMQDPR